MTSRVALISGVLLAAGSAAWSQALELVRDGQSAYRIHHASDAPPSVVEAAQELQRAIEAVSGARLPITTEPGDPMVALGYGAASRDAGVGLDGVALEGYRMAVRGRNLFILGPDTGEGEWTPRGGTSAGTRNGTYAFIEAYLGVRWLTPLEHGEWVPQTPTVVLPEIDRTDAPFFLNRRLPYTQERTPAVRLWQQRQGLGHSLLLTHGHNWERPTPASLFDAHPEWFPERGGVRVPPTGWYKLCLGNPDLIRHFAAQVIAHFDANPASTCYSLSPSDGGGWCECARCTALYETDPDGRRSVTPAVLQFYNGVAEIVRQRHPGKILAGYVYAAYVYPPSRPFRLAPNLFLVWAPSFAYGYTLFRPDLRERWEYLLAKWTESTENLAYYDLPNRLGNDAGAPNPPGLAILKFIYPRLKRAGIKGVYVYGQEAWGYGGPANYLQAKLAWNPDADVDALFDEYLRLAYADAAEDMHRFHALLETELERYYQENPEAGWVLTTAILRDVYARHFAALERFYRAAEAKLDGRGSAAQRLADLGENLAILHWNLRQFGLLEAPRESGFFRPDDVFMAALPQYRNSLAVKPVRIGAEPPGQLGRVAIAPAAALPNAQPMQRFLLRGNQHVLLAPTGGGDITVRFSRITARGKLLSWAAFNAEGAEVDRGLVSADAPLRLDPAGSAYYHLTIAGGSASYAVEVAGAAWAVSDRLSNKGLHKLQHMTPLYFEVPAGVSAFNLQIEAEAPGETAAASLLAPDGTEAASFDATRMSVDRQEITVGPGRSGWWKLVVRDAGVGVTDDVWIRGGEPLTGWFSLDPNAALSVRPAR